MGSITAVIIKPNAETWLSERSPVSPFASMETFSLTDAKIKKPTVCILYENGVVKPKKVCRFGCAVKIVATPVTVNVTKVGYISGNVI